MALEISQRLPDKAWSTGFVKRHGDEFKVIQVQGMKKSRHTAENHPSSEDHFDLVCDMCPSS